MFRLCVALALSAPGVRAFCFAPARVLSAARLQSIHTSVYKSLAQQQYKRSLPRLCSASMSSAATAEPTIVRAAHVLVADESLADSGKCAPTN
jgi:hypoxanthine phosphoribosyltransferase